MLAIGVPLNVDSTVRSRFADLLKRFEGPNVNLSLQVTEATDQKELRERTDADGVSVAFTELE